MKIKELREKGIEELKKLLDEIRENARRVRFDIASKSVKNTRELRNDKRDIARILTLIKENNGKE